jgi:aminomethyltransferase
LHKTPLFEQHLAAGAKMVPFAGYEMPVSYTGIRQEHTAVRTSCGLFDTSHMGIVFAEGKGVAEFLDSLTCNHVAALMPGDVHYNALMLENGAALDDILVYCLAEHSYMLVVNASNKQVDVAYMQKTLPSSVTLRLASELAMLALQGPTAVAVAKQVLGEEGVPSKWYKVQKTTFQGVEVIVSRTGYTGEDGVEFYVNATNASSLWDALLQQGGLQGLQLCGLGARDTLRLESGYCLYGHELTPHIHVLEAGLGWVVAWEKGSFVGREELLKLRERGLQRKLVGLEMLEKAIPREGYEVQVAQKTIGVVTSGTQSPSLDKAIAMALLEMPYAVVGEEVDVMVRGVARKAKVVNRRFYRRIA